MRHLHHLAWATLLSVLVVVAVDDDMPEAEVSQRAEPPSAVSAFPAPVSTSPAMEEGQQQPRASVEADHGPFAPRPPGYVPRNLSYGAAAPMASGQDLRGLRSGLPPVDLSD
jgi:hypothetical protein